MTNETEGTGLGESGQEPIGSQIGDQSEDQDAEPTTMAPAGESPTDPGPVKEAREQQREDEPGTP